VPVKDIRLEKLVGTLDFITAKSVKILSAFTAGEFSSLD
jgi:hypothetical protein